MYVDPNPKQKLPPEMMMGTLKLPLAVFGAVNVPLMSKKKAPLLRPMVALNPSFAFSTAGRGVIEKLTLPETWHVATVTSKASPTSVTSFRSTVKDIALLCEVVPVQLPS